MRSRRRPKTAVIAQQGTLARLGQLPQNRGGRTEATSQLLPQFSRVADPEGQDLTQGVFEDFDSGQKPLPGPLQAAGLHLLRRRVGSRTHLRLSIEVGPQSLGLQGTVGQTVGRKDRHRPTTGHTPVALNAQPLLSRRLGIPLIRAVSLQRLQTTVGTPRSIPLETVSPNLDAPVKTTPVVKIKTLYSRELGINPPSLRLNGCLLLPVFSQKRYISELPPVERFDQLSNRSKHFIDTIKIIAYRAETALAHTLREKIPAHHKDEARSLARQIFQTEANLIPDPQAGTLTVEIHGLSTPRDDAALDHLCAELTATQTKYPGTDLLLIYRKVSS